MPLRAQTHAEWFPRILFAFAVALAVLSFEQGVHALVPRQVTVISGGTTFHRVTMLDWQATAALAVAVIGLGWIAQGWGRSSTRAWWFIGAGSAVAVWWMLWVLMRYVFDSTPSGGILFGNLGPEYYGSQETMYHGAFAWGDPRPQSDEPPYWWHDVQLFVRIRVDPIWDAMFVLWIAFDLFLAFAGFTLVRGSRRKSTNRCLKCGYDRTGLAAGVVCPECGAAAG